MRAKPLSLAEVRDWLLTLPQVAEAEIEGEEPVSLRVEVIAYEDVEYIIAACLMIDRSVRRRGDSRILVVEAG